MALLEVRLLGTPEDVELAAVQLRADPTLPILRETPNLPCRKAEDAGKVRRYISIELPPAAAENEAQREANNA